MHGWGYKQDKTRLPGNVRCSITQNCTDGQGRLFHPSKLKWISLTAVCKQAKRTYMLSCKHHFLL